MSDTSTPTPNPSPAPPAFKPNRATQDVKDCPLADSGAYKTWSTLKGNLHMPNSLGRSWQEADSMVCDCSFQIGRDDAYLACGEGSDCINRLTQVECLESECRCGGSCQNQRFTRRQYANIEVIETARKGYGLRAAEPIAADTFIYEYVGEVVEKKAFMDRMQAYAEEGIRHFYFMELQKDEYIDATRKGGIGRFANHSCNPNCYVAKWVVGKRMRMGIFAKRDVAHGEELTFNYNVDRYGHDAQPCYCDEPNCVGSIGGKTQTDVGGMDDLFLDALGISAEVEQKGMKGSKKKRGLKLGEDFNPILKPIQEIEVPKFVAATRQATSNRPVLSILLKRMKMTEEDAVLRRVMHLHGFGMMNTVLKDFKEDKEVLQLALESMSVWPLVNRNKVEDSAIDAAVREALEYESADEEIKRIGNDLLSKWESLPTGYRIRRRVVIPDLEDDSPTVDNTAALNALYERRKSPVAKRESLFTLANNTFQRPEPTEYKPGPRPSLPSLHKASNHTPTPPPIAAPQPSRYGVDDFLAQAVAAKAEEERKATEKAEAEAAARAAEKALINKLKQDKGKAKEKKRKRQSTGGKPEPRGNEAHKEKALLSLVGEVVVKSMSKYKDQMQHSKFKEYAKQCAQAIVAKEKKSAKFITASQVPPLSEEKKAKIKQYTKDYTHRLLRKLKKAAAASGSSAGGAADGGGDGGMSAQIAAEMAAENPEEDEDDEEMEDEDATAAPAEDTAAMGTALDAEMKVDGSTSLQLR